MALHLASKFRTRLPFVAFAALGGVFSLASAALVVVIERKAGDEFTKHQTPWIFAALIFCFALICYLLHSLLGRIEELYSRNRLEVRYFPAGSKSDTAKMYRAASDLFDLAETGVVCEIFAVNCFDDAHAHSSKDDEAAHTRYFQRSRRL
jgi:hypothetical protein